MAEEAGEVGEVKTGECNCIELEQKVEQLREEVDRLREDVDYIIDRKGLRELMDDE